MSALVSRSELDAYIKARQLIADEAKSTIDPLIQQLDYTDISAARNRVIQIMDAQLSTSADMSAQLGAEFYNLVRERSIGEEFEEAGAYSGRRPEATDGFVRAAIQDMVDGKPGAFFSKCSQRCDYEVQRANGTSIYRNGERDRQIVRFARVPSGRETCPFCIMLASRGAVYYTAETAGGNGHYHSKCDCVILPVFVGAGVPIGGLVEGYDPQEYERQYNDLLADGTLTRSDLAKWSKDAKQRNGRSIDRTADTEGTMFPTGTRAMIRYMNEAVDLEDAKRRVAEVARDFDMYWKNKRNWDIIAKERDRLFRRLAS